MAECRLRVYNGLGVYIARGGWGEEVPAGRKRAVSSDPETNARRAARAARQMRYRERQKQGLVGTPLATPPPSVQGAETLPREPAERPQRPSGVGSARIEARDAEIAGRIEAYLHASFTRRQGRGVALVDEDARGWLSSHPLVLAWVADYLTQEGLGPEFRRWWRP